MTTKTRILTVEGQRLVSEGSYLLKDPLKSKILMSIDGGGGEGGLAETNFQLLMLSPNLLKSQIPMSGEGGGEVGGNQFPTFDAESKFAKIPNSHVRWRGGVGSWWKPISKS